MNSNKKNYMDNTLYFSYLDWTETRDFSVISDIKDAFKDIPNKLSNVANFIRDAYSKSKLKISQWIEILKSKPIFELIEKSGFSIKKFYDMIHDSYTKYIKLITDEIGNYIQNTKVGKWTTKEAEKLDKWLEKNPKIRKIGGVAVALILIYINLHVTYFGDFQYDFNMDDVANALTGHYSLAQIFASPAGYAFLIMAATNAVGLSFPWSTPAKLIGILGGTLYKLIRNKSSKKFSRMRLIYNRESRCFSNSVSDKIPSGLSSKLQDVAQEYNSIDYGDIMKFNYTQSKGKILHKLIDSLYKSEHNSKKESELLSKISNIVKNKI